MKRRSFFFNAKTGVAVIALIVSNPAPLFAAAAPPTCAPLKPSPVAPGCTGTYHFWSEYDDECCDSAICTAAMAGEAHWGFGNCVPAPTVAPGYCYVYSGKQFCDDNLTIPGNVNPQACTIAGAESINCCWNTIPPNSCHTLENPAATPAPTPAPVCGPAPSHPSCAPPADRYDADNTACCTGSTCVYPSPGYPVAKLQFSGCTPIPAPAPGPAPAPAPVPAPSPVGAPVPSPTLKPAPSAGIGCRILGGNEYCTR